MKNTNKKGFTIVELVIVIAVIAILAAVLIPTFVGLVNKANVAADTALGRELNSAIAQSQKKVDTFDEAIEALKDGGFILANLNAKADGCYFVWEDETNQILYVDANDGFKVIYSNGSYKEIGATWYLAVSNKEKADAIKKLNNTINVKLTLANVKDLSAALAAGGEVYIDESVVLDKNNKITINDNNADVTLKFGGSKVTTGSTIQGIPVEVKHGKLTVYDAVVGGAGEFTNENGTFSTAVGFDGTTKLYLNNCTIAGIGNAVAGSNNDDGEAYVEINNCTLSSNNVGFQLATWGTGVLNNTTINCPNPIFASYGANITIDGGDYTSTSDCMIELHDNTANAPEGKTTTVTIKKGNFTFETFAIFNGSSKIVIEGGTFNGVNYLEYFNSADAANAITGGATINVDGNVVTITK